MKAVMLMLVLALPQGTSTQIPDLPCGITETWLADYGKVWFGALHIVAG